MKRICYKILWKDEEDRLWSYFFRKESRHSVEYVHNTIVNAPQGSKLFVFDSLANALNLIDVFDDLVIYRVLADGVEDPPDRILDPLMAFFEPELVEGYWSNSGDLTNHKYAPVPKGTLLCDSLELLHEEEQIL